MTFSCRYKEVVRHVKNGIALLLELLSFLISFNLYFSKCKVFKKILYIEIAIILLKKRRLVIFFKKRNGVH